MWVYLGYGISVVMQFTVGTLVRKLFAFRYGQKCNKDADKGLAVKMNKDDEVNILDKQKEAGGERKAGDGGKKVCDRCNEPDCTCNRSAKLCSWFWFSVHLFLAGCIVFALIVLVALPL